MTLRVNEIFFSIQGESLYSGRPCIFIRLTGCNLRCTYCDTTYAYEDGASLSIPAILRKVKQFDSTLVEITGGEPLLQPETPKLIKRLLDAGYEVLIETNGSMDISTIDPRCIKILDVKCPSSGESDKNFIQNFYHLTGKDQIKFVIGTQEDYGFAKSFLNGLPLQLPRHHVLFSPISGKMPLDVMAEWILEDKLPVRLHIQLHKYIWPDVERGR